VQSPHHKDQQMVQSPTIPSRLPIWKRSSEQRPFSASSSRHLRAALSQPPMLNTTRDHIKRLSDSEVIHACAAAL
jgi:hypothetical protein